MIYIICSGVLIEELMFS